MFLNMVSERYPREKDDDAFAFDSDIDEDEESDDAAFVSAIPESSSSHDRIVFGSFESPITPVSTPLIEPEFDGFSISRLGRFHVFLLLLAATSSMKTILCSLIRKKMRIWKFLNLNSQIAPLISSFLQTKFRQRGILKYLIFGSESGPLLSVFIFLFNYNFHLLFKFLINFKFCF